MCWRDWEEVEEALVPRTELLEEKEGIHSEKDEVGADVRSLWKRTILATSRHQRRDSQSRLSNSVSFGVDHGDFNTQRATLACTRSIAIASSSVIEPCPTGEAYCITGLQGILKNSENARWHSILSTGLLSFHMKVPVENNIWWLSKVKFQEH